MKHDMFENVIMQKKPDNMYKERFIPTHTWGTCPEMLLGSHAQPRWTDVVNIVATFSDLAHLAECLCQPGSCIQEEGQNSKIQYVKFEKIGNEISNIQNKKIWYSWNKKVENSKTKIFN